MTRTHDRHSQSQRSQRGEPGIGRAMRAQDVRPVAVHPATQREQPTEALRRDGERYRAQAPIRSLAIDAGFERTNEGEVMAPVCEPPGLRQNAQLLPAPAERGLGVNDFHAAARSAAYWMR